MSLDHNPEREMVDTARPGQEKGHPILVGVRETAWSYKPGFSKSALQAALLAHGITYIHADFAGNPKWLRANAESHRQCLDWYSWYLGEFEEIVSAFERLLSEQLREGKRVCVMCFERHPGDCHRAILAREWQARGPREVLHLAMEGCERLLSTWGRSSCEGRFGYRRPTIPKFFGWSMKLFRSP